MALPGHIIHLLPDRGLCVIVGRMNSAHRRQSLDYCLSLDVSQQVVLVHVQLHD